MKAFLELFRSRIIVNNSVDHRYRTKKVFIPTSRYAQCEIIK